MSKIFDDVAGSLTMASRKTLQALGIYRSKRSLFHSINKLQHGLRKSQSGWYSEHLLIIGPFDKASFLRIAEILP